MSAEMKTACQFNFHRFYQEYFWHLAVRPMQPCHLGAFAKIEAAVMAVVPSFQSIDMPSGEGKSAFAMAAALWAQLYGHRTNIDLFKANRITLEQLHREFKSEFSANKLLKEDFANEIASIEFSYEGPYQLKLHKKNSGKLYANQFAIMDCDTKSGIEMAARALHLDMPYGIGFTKLEAQA